jgi:hypothetical protein
MISDYFQNLFADMEHSVMYHLLRGLLFFVITAALLAGYAISQFRSLRDADAMEYAQLGRQAAAGRGMTTQCLRPVDIWFMQQHHKQPDLQRFPDLRHMPLYPAVAGWSTRLLSPLPDFETPFAIFPPEAQITVPLGICFIILTGLFLFLAARRLFDDRIAGLATLCFFVADTVLQTAICGGPLPMLMFLTTACAYMAIVAAQAWEDSRGAAGWTAFIAAAILGGAACLTAYSAIIPVIAIGIFAAAHANKGRTAMAGLFVLIVLIMVMPWLIRNSRICGSPFGLAPAGLLHDTFLYPGQSFDRTLAPDLNFQRTTMAIRQKFTDGILALAGKGAPAAGLGLLFCFFAASFFTRFETLHASRFRWAIGGSVVLLFAGGILFSNAELPRIVLPFCLIYGAAFLFTLIARTEYPDMAWPPVLVGLAVVLTAVPLAGRLLGPRAALPYPPYYPPFITHAAQFMTGDEILCTDMPWATAWYGGRTSLLLPKTTADVQTLRAAGLPVAGIYLTPETSNLPYAFTLASGANREWLALVNGRVPADFPFQHGLSFPPGSHDQIFLTDRARWQTQAATNDLAESADPSLVVRPAATP